MTDPVTIALIVGLTTGVPATIAAWASWQNGKKADAIHDAVNGGWARLRLEVVDVKAELTTAQAEIIAARSEIIALKKLVGELTGRKA